MRFYVLLFVVKNEKYEDFTQGQNSKDQQNSNDDGIFIHHLVYNKYFRVTIKSNMQREALKKLTKFNKCLTSSQRLGHC